jgi:micrococcal nuclease
MEIQGYPANEIRQARRVLLVGGGAAGCLGILAVLLVLFSAAAIPVLVIAILVCQGLCAGSLAGIYRGVPAVREKRELEKRLANARREHQLAGASPKMIARLPAIEHRQRRIENQLAVYDRLSFGSFLRAAAGTGTRLPVYAGGVGAAVGLLAACCLGVYSLTPATLIPGPPQFTSPEIILTEASTFTPSPETATPTRTRTATLLPTQTVSPPSTPTPLPSVTSTLTPQPAPLAILGGECLPLTAPQQAQVLDVLDGDTIEVRLEEDGSVHRLRYIGIDSPEPGAIFATESSAANAHLVEDQTVLLFKDVSEVDQFGRLLRYVVVGNSFVNYELVRLGFASAINYPPDETCASTLLQAEADARAAQAGWFAPGVLNPPGQGEPPPEVNDGSRSGCSPAYPDVCIPPPPPDLDCADVSARRFRVLPPDPHHFDGDGDGIGCES